MCFSDRRPVLARLLLRIVLCVVMIAGLSSCASRSADRAAHSGHDEPALTHQLASTAALRSSDLDDMVGYLCPMHPTHTDEEPGKCPICGMDLVLGTPFDMRDYRLDFRTEPAVPRAGETVTLEFGVYHPDAGELVRDFELVHEMPYHLFVVSQDMEFFEHIHPEQGEDGTWAIDIVLPKDGVYAVLSDFLPKGGSAHFMTRPLVTAGYTGDLLAQTARLVRDTTDTHTVDDLTVRLTYDPPIFRAGEHGHIRFFVTRTGTNEPVRELQTYLGAFGHMFVMHEDMVEYVHAHPEEMEMNAPVFSSEAQRGGPTVVFEGLMPKPGRYRAWTQFLYQDRLYTFANTFEVFDIGQRVSR
jgi:hypothetical protein